MKLVHNAFVALLAVLPLFAQADVITFTGEIPGPKPTFYTVNTVQFGASNGENLLVDNFVENGGDTALAASTDSDSYLVMLFPSVFNYLSLDFGNDDPARTTAGDLGLLLLFLGSDPTPVATVTLELNRNDIVDQTIFSSGVEFDSAIFAYTNSNFDPISLAELIDNVTFVRVDNAVPEPGTIAVFALGLVGIGLSRSRRKAL